MKRITIRSLLGRALVATGLLCSSATATWSIVVVDRATGEVCVASATCLVNFPLRKRLAVIAVGKGAGAAQSFVDTSGNNRRRIFNGLRLDRTPDEILAILEAADPGHESRQYGIVSLQHGAATFTGTGAGLARHGVTGEQGSMVYAIQGNVITGNAVVDAAEQALLDTDGDLGQRVMASMEAARAFGGDGRCSCTTGPPPSCGSPPTDFEKSAHTAFIVLARIGGEDGVCNGDAGCANGRYYLGRRYVGGAQDVDPVLAMQLLYDTWRLAKIGDVDELLTEVTPSASRLVADGTTTVDVRVRLRDIDGNPLALGGQILTVRGIGGPQPATVLGIADHGDGSHTITMQAGSETGSGRWRILVGAGPNPLFLHPPLELHFDPVTRIHAGFNRVSASAGADVPLVLNFGSTQVGKTYQVVAGASGTFPGSVFHGGVIPLTSDRLLRFTAAHPGPPLFPGSFGVLDGAGRAEATIRLGPSLLTQFVGGRLDFVGVAFGNPDTLTGPTGFDILP